MAASSSDNPQGPFTPLGTGHLLVRSCRGHPLSPGWDSSGLCGSVDVGGGGQGRPKADEVQKRPRCSTTQTGIVLDHEVMIGNPPDAPLLAPAIERLEELVGRVPRAVTADRGYGEANVDRALAA